MTRAVDRLGYYLPGKGSYPFRLPMGSDALDRKGYSLFARVGPLPIAFPGTVIAWGRMPYQPVTNVPGGGPSLTPS